jgi:hypothetical protein
MKVPVAAARVAAALLKSQGVQAEFVLDEGLAVVSDFPLPTAGGVGVAEKGATRRITAPAKGGQCRRRRRRPASKCYTASPRSRRILGCSLTARPPTWCVHRAVASPLVRMAVATAVVPAIADRKIRATPQALLALRRSHRPCQ